MRETVTIADLKNKDVKAFKVIFDQMFHHIRFYAEQIVKDRGDAEDIASQSFAKCWEILPNFNSIQGIQSFLYKTARNQSLNYIDKRKAESNYKNNLLHLSAQAMKEEVERIGSEAIMFEELYAQVILQVETLPNRTKEVFKKVFFERISRPEVAAQLQMTAGTVDVHISNAMKKLRSFFNEKDMALISLILLGCSQN